MKKIISHFVEKEDHETIRRYLNSKGMTWAGLFHLLAVSLSGIPESPDIKIELVKAI